MTATAVAAVRCEDLVHIYRTDATEVLALRQVDLVVRQGETVTLLGPSGSGKSTLLWLLGGLLRPTAGMVSVFGRRLTDLTPREVTELRATEVGTVLQNPGSNVLPHANALQNVLFAQRTNRASAAAKRRRSLGLLDAVGFAALAGRAAGALSGGEQQRLAVAVALANAPRLLLADEPTSQLDRTSAGAVLDLLRAANTELGTTIVVVSHDPDVGTALGRTVTIRDGRVGSEGRAGEQYVVVGKDGALTLPPEALRVLPSGSLARVVIGENSVELRGIAEPAADPEAESAADPGIEQGVDQPTEGAS
ncbi:MAG TPA: ATP-binding cassette domain-containing protein [Pseudonocardiaceae bacterium]|jgi:ABC-type lipoprotein export system ATPase subunit|nr:ATP-binding cassette domain-containing protein [Pseudonocardiaceae bacterium]